MPRSPLRNTSILLVCLRELAGDCDVSGFREFWVERFASRMASKATEKQQAPRLKHSLHTQVSQGSRGAYAVKCGVFRVLDVFWLQLHSEKELERNRLLNEVYGIGLHELKPPTNNDLKFQEATAWWSVCVLC